MRRIKCWLQGHDFVLAYWYWVTRDEERRTSICSRCGAHDTSRVIHE